MLSLPILVQKFIKASGFISELFGEFGDRIIEFVDFFLIFFMSKFRSLKVGFLYFFFLFLLNIKDKCHKSHHIFPQFF